MDRLNPLDAQFVDAEDEDRHTSMAIASIAVFEGPAPTYDELLTHLRGRLPLVPRYRQKLRKIPFRLGAPVWVDDPDFDLRFHVRQTALPQPGGDQQLNKLMARVMGQRLDRDYPLWEYWLVQGLADGRWALISKIHHCMVDGVSGTDLYRVIFDVSPNPSSPAAVDDRVIPEPPSSLSLAAQAAVDMVMMPVREASALGSALANPGAAVQQVTDMARAMLRMASSMLPATGSSLSGPIGQQRRYTWARASLDDVKTIKRKLGGTVNDVVLAAISGAFRDLLLSRGEEPEPFMMPSLVPVSVRAPGEENIYENRVSAILAYLPVHIADPVDRLSAIRAEISALKASHESKVMETLVSLGRFTPYPVASVGVQLAYSLHQREIVTVTTNVPGPRQPLYGLGRRLVEIIPYVPIATTMRTGVSIFTYCGDVTFGITGDYASNPDIEVLARGIENGLIELLKAANQVTAPAAPPAGDPGPAVKVSTTKPSTPKASAAKSSTPKPRTPKASAAKSSTPKPSTPKPSTPKASAAKSSTVKTSTARASKASS
jgi:WS/DGAT/MGAT family acyltransferase